MEPHCEKCDSTDQLVFTQDGAFCRAHYPEYKRRKVVGQEIREPDNNNPHVGGYDDC